jgi:hypothetical protein
MQSISQNCAHCNRCVSFYMFLLIVRKIVLPLHIINLMIIVTVFIPMFSFKGSNTRSDKKGKIDKISDGSSGSHGRALDGYPSKIPFFIRPCI